MATNSANNVVYPNFMIAGAAKAGTTSLYYWLKQHPDVFMSKSKESCYFAPEYGMRIADWTQYLALFEPGRAKKVIGESSAIYIEDPQSPRLIYDALGKIKIIFILRNPTDRALSYYCWNLMYGDETANG